MTIRKDIGRILASDQYHKYIAYIAAQDLGVVAAYNANKAFLTVVNPADSPWWVVLEHLRTRVAVADTNSTNIQVDIRHDPTDRTAVSPGGAAVTSKKRLITSPQTSPLLVRAGAVTPKNADAGELQLIATTLQTDSAPAFDLNDVFLIDFDIQRPQSSLYVGPLVLGPGETALVHVFGTSMASDAPDLEPMLHYRLVQQR